MTEEGTEAARGLGVPDMIALVLGAAIAAVHVRGVLGGGLTAPGWLLALVTYAWIALTASGPFVVLARRLARRDRPAAGDRRLGELLWAGLGLPWALTAGLRPRPPAAAARPDELFAGALSVGLACACLAAILVLWRFWIAVSPEQAARTFAGPWTNRVGLVLAIAWPIQCGAGMVVVG